MPQMMPLYWLIMLIFSLIILNMLINFFYFIFKFNFFFLKKMNLFKKWIWLW